MTAPKPTVCDAERTPARFLLIEDDRIDTEYALRTLRKSGCAAEILSVTSVEAAQCLLDASDTAPPRIILTDVNLPGASGLDFLEVFVQRPPTVPPTILVLLVSVDLRRADALRLERLGRRVTTAPKPFRREDVLRWMTFVEDADQGRDDDA